MHHRKLLWIVGAATALLYARVGLFMFITLVPELECHFGPELRFWGYDAAVFSTCFASVSDGVRAQYVQVLLGVDRGLAVALGALLTLWSVRSRIWIAAVAGLAYGLSDWFENGFLVAALGGDLAAVKVASLLTTSKIACLTLVIGVHIRVARRNRSDR